MTAHPDIGMVLHEPFCSKYANTERQVRSLFVGTGRRCAGLKLMMHHIDPTLLRRWMDADQLPVVFLKRDNHLRTAVSDRLARQTDWDKQKLSKTYRTDKFQPLDSLDIYQQSRWYRQIIDRFDQTLHGYPVFSITYEDFYLRGGWRQDLVKIYEHVGYRPFLSSKAIQLMETQRVNDERTYLNIPNVYEIERKCGSNENGWLLNCSPLML